MHQSKYDRMQQSGQLTFFDQQFIHSPVFRLSIYPSDELYDVYETVGPVIGALGAVAVVILTCMVFFTYDFCVRRVFRDKERLQEVKRQYVRFISHEVRSPLNAVYMGLTLLLEEMATALGYENANDLWQKEKAQQLKRLREEPVSHRGATAESVSSPNDASPGDRCDSLQWFFKIQQSLVSAKWAVGILNDLLCYETMDTNSLRLEFAMFRPFHALEAIIREYMITAESQSVNLSAQTLPMRISSWRAQEDKAGSEAQREDYPPDSDILKFCCYGDKPRLLQTWRNLLDYAISSATEDATIHIRTLAADADRGTRSNTPLRVKMKNNESLELESTNKRLRLEITESRPADTSALELTSTQPARGAPVKFDVSKLQTGFQGTSSGLGLYIAKSIIERHDGGVFAFTENSLSMEIPLYYAPGQAKGRFSSLVDEGPSFHFSQPAGRSTRKASFNFCDVGEEEGEESDIEKQISPRLLAVDDIQSNRKLMGRLLERQGYRVDVAADGQEAIDLIEKSVKDDDIYHTVLMDYEMPVMNGPDAVKELRRRGYQNLYIVGVTGNMLPEDVDHFKQCGANEVLPKPFRLNALVELWSERVL